MEGSSRDSICNDLFILASDIVKDKDSQEHQLRTAVSRAYYCVFLTVRDRLFGPDAINFTSRKQKLLDRKYRTKGRPSGSHERILVALEDIPATAVLRPLTLLHQIDELKEARVHADYDFTHDRLKDVPYATWTEYANHMVALASQVLPLARRLPSYPS
ncbi:MAG: hypothetical protein HY529_06520 [Chloroflexi bacterium]|nr:hypothetical protein [Chloroflexota bacterium]